MPKTKAAPSGLTASIKRLNLKPDPLWEGPCSDGPQGGLTQSLLSRWLCCRERFRLKVVDGLRTPDEFNVRLEYGNLWHVCEEHAPVWETPLRAYADDLLRRYPTQQDQVRHWYRVCRVQYPLYEAYWAKHPDVTKRVPIANELTFRAPYVLPSGRTVWMRGKFDGVDKVGKRTVLQENKTKGDIKEAEIHKQMGFDLQTLWYVIALMRTDLPGGHEIKGIPEVRYNVVRRPLAGGKGSIVRHKPTKSNPEGESEDEFYARLKGIIEGAEGPDWGTEGHYFFMRWNVSISPADLERFERRFLVPCLEDLCDWWERISTADDPFDPACRHYQFPYGVWNPLTNGAATDFDELLATGSRVGLERADTLFRELE